MAYLECASTTPMMLSGAIPVFGTTFAVAASRNASYSSTSRGIRADANNPQASLHQ
jgi:hypothetical protein